MAEKQEATERAYTSPQVNPYGRVDEEIASVAEKEERRKKRMKCFVYLIAFIVFQTGVFLIFGLTIMKVRTPRFRVMSASFDTFDVATLDTNPSFNIRMITQLGVRNRNFGHYKYQNSTIEFFYQGTKVGEAFVPRARAKARATRKFNVTVDISSAAVPRDVLANEFRTHAVIPLRSQARLRGKVEIMKIMKKNRSSNMNCSMEINISSRQLGNISCR
ncbi:late embryogenesis abundant protein At1g64065-like [Sesamum indicum]|uniref:Late embryogenesis abundant protein At1g64065-like n=1 Tax=Sesamum indicum TaxID=4182 RepID=A0A6I9T363_SESIN|nr:late embryogenesis abundant protein At1g64065-like [Sesamum indicum]